MTNKKNPRYMIGSGWWCEGNDTQHAFQKGDSLIRSQQFHSVWYQLICRFTSTDRILIVDSASPIPPPVNTADNRFHVHRLATNLGHAVNTKGQFCGWTASVLTGLLDCLHSDFDYFVYIEQDVLLWGEKIIEKAISTMSSPYMFGDATGIPQPLQQSFFIIRKDGIAPFLSNILAIPESDRDFSPERKFHYACQSRMFSRKAFRWLGRYRYQYDFLPFGYGRKRPLDFESQHFYFQHATGDEFSTFSKQLKARFNIDTGII